jgi:hypothetical protein
MTFMTIYVFVAIASVSWQILEVYHASVAWQILEVYHFFSYATFCMDM